MSSMDYRTTEVDVRRSAKRISRCSGSAWPAVLAVGAAIAIALAPAVISGVYADRAEREYGRFAPGQVTTLENVGEARIQRKAGADYRVRFTYLDGGSEVRYIHSRDMAALGFTPLKEIEELVRDRGRSER